MRKKLSARLAHLRAHLTAAALRRAIGHLIVRTYAAALFLILIYCGYLSVSYLIYTVFFPPALPVEVEKWPARLDVAALRSNDAAGVELPAPRAPLSHFHRVDQWLQQDRFNGCILSGCHQPLPHDLSAKVPAFANFHTTFLACQMCHQPAIRRPGSAQWIDIETGQPQNSPPILRLMILLETDTATITTRPSDVQSRIESLLSQAIADLGGDPMLDELLSQIQSAQPGSPVWRQSITLLTAELPQHARGEYRAKLIWSDLAETELARYQQSKDQAAQFAATTDPHQRDAILKQIHAPLATEPVECLACHDNRPSMLDFSAVGFSPRRSQYLSSLEIARLMQQIREGQRFYLPNLEFAQ